MCGIVGYIGQAGDSRDYFALDVVVEGLRRLEYRGYDSAGIAIHANGEISYRKKAGKVAALDAEIAKAPLPDSILGIGHTRWATHGGPTDVNAHPHVVSNGKLAVVHNGIIENFAELRSELSAKGYNFVSDTDTEVAASLLAEIYNTQANGDLTLAMQLTGQRLEGAFTLLAIHADHDDRIVAARRNSPLVIGVGEGENFLGSDVSGFIDYTRKAVELANDQVVTITADDYAITNFDGSEAVGKPFDVEWDAAAAEKGGFGSFMEKEIHDQPAAVRDTLMGRLDEDGKLVLDELRIDEAILRSVDKIVIVACGTAAYAGQVARYAIEHWCRIPTEVELAHEFRYRDPILNEKTLVVALSQSGETMDTLMAVRHAREQGAKVVAICNTVGSTLPREADASLYTYAGPEIAVASTKAFLAQITASYLLGLYLAQLRGNKFADEVSSILDSLREMPEKIQQVIDAEEQIKKLGQDMADAKSVLFLGRHVGFPVALEGALKLKEIAYLHAEGFAAGELKHGPIALVEEGQPIFVIVPSPRGRDSLHSKVVSNIQEIRARGAVTIVIAEEGDEAVNDYANFIIRIPQAPTLMQPLLSTVPLQIFACAVATAKGYNVDQPRNLAKSVTVE
ncbi:glutamine-fructose-6-phosphate transaminase (isomerizing) [Corynebacterium glutamicum MB001]|uniref:Glutamine--fructose-6-phosphate aminotransferase [isomerizing] n=1 Tax=Corynebacterium glutamicum (strain ATCC 13032 / DSM 20300 / JCM 1318 / BCRC 11384 / CCUG 27702 / LMG 3730 / NBRC 12168 / NCIMB 10025 / NRRL B-2784 / 534) TaxID=196627 RepID=GLMS_CORGL|nr:glutamine--fructose-6-phosphate transaminase (isomerizing) [Corynebacterium glutamicum]Q8NND3.2 RecName: Full=Glutamine--fructose-6-phosphate aminotransferase [isomerizing]; AltName: Full=D-fructose-6-phosphate amidotransferase; AltName: Full=GFAT; AltName: Full=Glucosamine-6-phosphate synthase; AltName: Full=Hexosephosphate aminotransferase; AltName: Full=L-glutamine--D-fructose-6-phosphate amidotransferase [Corynebacterium glutamicum ATCC 13032]AGT06001.1 glutamine-fructose-6-phosphate trans